MSRKHTFRWVFPLLVGSACLLIVPGRLLALEESLSDRDYDAAVAKALASMEHGVLARPDGITLHHYTFHPDPKTGPNHGTIVIAPGYTENHLKYAETAIDLMHKGYTVRMIEHRGMGWSGRLAPDPQVVHVASFQDYVDDFTAYVEQIVVPGSKGDIFLLAHSTGALVGTLAFGEKPGPFRAAVFTSPLFGVATGWMPEWLALGLTRTLSVIGQERSFVPGRGHWNLKQALREDSSATLSRTRRHRQIRNALAHPDMIQSGPSNGWVREAIIASRHNIDIAPRVRLPILILRATNDTFVQPQSQLSFCTKAMSCQAMLLGPAKHELLQESDPIRLRVLNQTIEFFAAHSSRPY